MTEMEQEKRASLNADVMLRRALDLRVKNNVLIAEFMGMEDYQEMGEYVTPRYRTSWDWLMPVVEKCRVDSRCEHDEDIFWDAIHWALEECSIENTYQAVVEFINQYKK